MTILCLFCKEKGKSGRSRVLASRRTDFRGILVDTRIRSKTMSRRRECLECKHRWVTVEIVQPGSSGFGAIHEGACRDPERFAQIRGQHDENSGAQSPTDDTEHRALSGNGRGA